ncbi:hypothetical protein L2E82_09038 [Cichorium intybus]|uniref:Uncharacterized protein n=1 Tax=Cichorium intybus TaxID=13427 RepID=A0ACB9G803_CICIN|nr:hypothetical protein L2E82_09038 [Cichorium intybus]
MLAYYHHTAASPPSSFYSDSGKCVVAGRRGCFPQRKYGTSIKCLGFFVRHALIVVITNASNLHGYTLRSLYKAIQTSGDQEPITVTGSDSIDAIKVAIMRHTSSDLTPGQCV